MPISMTLLLFIVWSSSSVNGVEPVMIIPRPLLVSQSSGAPFVLAADTVIHAADDTAGPVAGWLQEMLAVTAGVSLAVDAERDGLGIVLSLESDLGIGETEWAQAEAYRLTVSSGQVRIAARSAHGLFNGCTTLIQLPRVDEDGVSLPALVIEDAPRFRWRGLMLDCSRHFFTVAEVKRFIDLLALHKFNRFHWHLTDDPGWRVEVHAKPKLTSVGAWRSESPVMGDASVGDGQPYGGFYTQDDIRAVVAHAASRQVTVVPEIEMPGHSSATIAAYPEIGNHDVPDWQPPQPASLNGIKHTVLSPREETFAFIEAVFDEILPLFPGEYVHIGGDEAPKAEWNASPFAQEVIAQHGLKDAHELQAWFIGRVEAILAKRGKRLIGWDEIQEGGLSPSATMMVWRKWEWAVHALERGNCVVMAPESHTYFDYRQPDTPDLPQFQTIGSEHWRPMTSNERVFQFEPIPEGTSEERAANVLGAQGQLWTEYIWSQAKLEYMTWPRSCILAECIWSGPERDWADLSARLEQHLLLLRRLDVNFRCADGQPAFPGRSLDRTPRPPPADAGPGSSTQP